MYMANGFKFEEIGLETRDKRVYEALIASPQSSLRKIAADTCINRGSVYESIKKLSEKGLVGSIEVGKQRRYTASSPQTIIELLHERQQQAAQAQADDKSMPVGSRLSAGRRLLWEPDPGSAAGWGEPLADASGPAGWRPG